MYIYNYDTGYGSPTSVDFLHNNPNHMVAGYSSAKAVVYDLETGQPIINLDSGTTYGKGSQCGQVGVGDGF